MCVWRVRTVYCSEQRIWINKSPYCLIRRTCVSSQHSGKVDSWVKSYEDSRWSGEGTESMTTNRQMAAHRRGRQRAQVAEWLAWRLDYHKGAGQTWHIRNSVCDYCIMSTLWFFWHLLTITFCCVFAPGPIVSTWRAVMQGRKTSVVVNTHTYIYIYCFYIYVFDDIKIIDLYRIICFLLLPFYSCGKYLAAICFEDRFAGGQISVGTLSITLTNTAGVVLLMQTLEGF